MLPFIDSSNPSATMGNIGIQLGSMLHSAKDYIKEHNLSKPLLDSFNQQTDPYAKVGMEIGSALNGVPDDLDAARQSAMDAISQFVDPAGESSTYSPVSPARNSGRTVSTLSGGNPGFEYLNADLAKHYGMDKTAAYSEALQNTAYQRAVADLKAAGLNPVLAAGKVGAAGAFAAGDTLSGGSGSGSSGRRSGGNSGKYAMSSDMYNFIGTVSSLAGAVLGYVTTPGSPVTKMSSASAVSYATKNIAQSAIQAFGSGKNIFNR